MARSHLALIRGLGDAAAPAALTQDGNPSWDVTLFNLPINNDVPVTVVRGAGFVAGAGAGYLAAEHYSSSMPTKAAGALAGGLLGFFVGKLVEDNLL